MVVKKASFVKSCVSLNQYPESDMPEVAFAGRSNVGKSSLLNALVNRKNLAKVGKTPGVTTLINFFNVDDKLHLVDLPGYGFAATSKSDKEAWGSIIETYLTKRDQLKLIIMMVDIRHKPSDDDILMYNWIKFRDIPHFILATKADKISRNQYKTRIDEIKKVLVVPDDIEVVPLSSEKRVGIEETWNLIEQGLDIKEGE